MTIEAQLQVLVNNFVADVTRLARQAAMDTVGSLLSQVGMPGTASAAAPARSAATSLPRRARGGKRPAGDLASLQQRLRDHVRRNPGQRVTAINAALATTTADVRLPLAKLIASGELRTTGQKRATQYFPA